MFLKLNKRKERVLCLKTKIEFRIPPAGSNCHPQVRILQSWKINSFTLWDTMIWTHVDHYMSNYSFPSPLYVYFKANLLWKERLHVCQDSMSCIFSSPLHKQPRTFAPLDIETFPHSPVLYTTFSAPISNLFGISASDASETSISETSWKH